jgi:hypothetical protein
MVPGCAAFVLSGLITFAPWPLRNTVWTGNPVFPEAMSLLGRSHFSEVQMQKWTRAHSPRDDQRGIAPRLEAARKQIIAGWRYGFVTLPLAAVAVALASKSRMWLFLLTLPLIHFVFWVGFTHLQGRFLVLSVPILVMLIAQSAQRGWHLVMIAAAIVNVGVSARVLFPRVLAMASAIGAEDLKPLLPDVAIDVLDRSQRPVALAGDAKAFWYQVPMARLWYRTVFDVDVKSGQSIVDAWCAGAPADATVIVDPTELRRFSTYYWMIPQYPGDEKVTFVWSGTRPHP